MCPSLVDCSPVYNCTKYVLHRTNQTSLMCHTCTVLVYTDLFWFDCETDDYVIVDRARFCSFDQPVLSNAFKMY